MKKDKKELGVDDLWKFVPRKSVLPIINAVLFQTDGTAVATDLKVTLEVLSGHQANRAIVISRDALEPVVKSRDWPARLQVTVREETVIRDKEEHVVERWSCRMLTRNGMELTLGDDQLYSAVDFPKWCGKVDWEEVAELGVGDMQTLLRVAPLADDDLDKALCCVLLAKGNCYSGTPFALARVPVDYPGTLKIRVDVLKHLLSQPLTVHSHPWGKDGDSTVYRYSQGGANVYGFPPEKRDYPSQAIDNILHEEVKDWSMAVYGLDNLRVMLAQAKPWIGKGTYMSWGVEGVVRLFGLEGANTNNPTTTAVNHPALKLESKYWEGDRGMLFSLNPVVLSSVLATLPPDAREVAIRNRGFKWVSYTDGRKYKAWQGMLIEVAGDEGKWLVMPINNPDAPDTDLN